MTDEQCKELTRDRMKAADRHDDAALVRGLTAVAKTLADQQMHAHRDVVWRAIHRIEGPDADGWGG